MPFPRLLIDQPLKEGARLVLDEGQARHVGTVLRLGEGDALRLFNAADGEWRAKILEKSKRGMVAMTETKLREAKPAPDLDLLFAPVKRQATDLIVEKATELGARRLRPVITSRTIAETVRLDRLNAIAREAAEQTERFDAPEILEPVTLAKIVDGWEGDRPLIYADESGDDEEVLWGGDRGRARPILEAVQALLPLSLVERGQGVRGVGHAPSSSEEPQRPSDQHGAQSSAPPPPPLLPAGRSRPGLQQGPDRVAI